VYKGGLSNKGRDLVFTSRPTSRRAEESTLRAINNNLPLGSMIVSPAKPPDGLRGRRQPVRHHCTPRTSNGDMGVVRKRMR